MRWEAETTTDALSLRNLPDGDEPSPVSGVKVEAWSDPPSEWPPTASLERIRDLLLENTGVDVGQLEDVAPLVRYVAEGIVFEYLDVDDRALTLLYRRFIDTVRRTWHQIDVASVAGLPALRTSVEPVDQYLLDDGVVAAVTHLAVMGVAIDPLNARRVLKALGERYGVETMVTTIPTNQSYSPRFVVLTRAITQEMARMVARPDPTHFVTEIQSAPHSPLAADTFDGSRALAIARDMRKAPPLDRVEIAERYLELRAAHRSPRRVEETDAVAALARHAANVRNDVEADGALLALADQAVQLMLLDLKNEALLLRMSEVIRSSPSPFAYHPLDMRNQGLLSMKLGAHYGRALALMLSARADLDRSGGIGSPFDGQSLLESSQQISLSAGGVCVRILEEALLAPSIDAADEHIAAYATAAIRWSR